MTDGDNRKGIDVDRLRSFLVWTLRAGIKEAWQAGQPDFIDQSP
jgi:hypothetical protein